MQSPSPIATAGVHLPVRLDWLDRRREEIIEPDLPIVDPHHHLVDLPETGRYLLPELLADTGSGHNITPSTSNGCRCTARQDRSRCAGSAKSSSPTVSQQWRRAATTAIHGSAPASLVGYADLALGAPVEKVLQAMIQAGGGRFQSASPLVPPSRRAAKWSCADPSYGTGQ